MPPTRQAINDILDSGRPVIVAIYGTVETAYSPEHIRNMGGDIMEWRKTIKRVVESKLESAILEGVGGRKNLHLVDRENVERALKEMRLGASGVLSGQNRIQAGKILGATHFYIYQFTRNPAEDRTENDDHLARRLIDAETGAVLASDVFKIE